MKGIPWALEISVKARLRQKKMKHFVQAKPTIDEEHDISVATT
jgi:hypothetical protein